MKKVGVLLFVLFVCVVSNAQGIYQIWGASGAFGNNNLGVLFNANERGENLKVNHQFKLDHLGSNPYGELAEFNGKFYGLTMNGGNNGGRGVIYEWDPLTNVYTKKIDIGPDLGWAGRTEQKLFLLNGKFYGAFYNGGQNQRGVIFEWDPLTNVYTRKFDFAFNTGVYPSGGLTLHAGKFYGLTTQSFDDAANQIGAVLFEWDPVSNIYTKKIDLYNTFYSWGNGGLTLHNGKLYGTMTRNHGSGHWLPSFIFEWDPATNSCVNKVDIEYQSPVYLSMKDGIFYGVVAGYGGTDLGLIFEWDPATNIYTKKFDFTQATGNNPMGPMTLYNNKFHGATEYGGLNNAGTLYEWDPATNTYTKKFDMNNSKGRRPWGPPMLYNGKFYGATLSGGTYIAGTLYEWDPATNVYTTKFELGQALGVLPEGSLVFKNGKVFGAGKGGDYDAGAIFEWDIATKKYTQKTDLKPNEATYPTGRLVFSNQKFYGVTQLGGANNAGVIFEWNEMTGVFTKRHDLVSDEGKRPMSGLVDYNGKLYGTCSEGGALGQGAIFEWDPATNVYIKKVDLSASGGSVPDGSLTIKDGKFYGVTQKGGVNNAGVIFEWDPVTNLYLTKFQFNTADGETPHGSLVLRKGKFYGITQKGGMNNSGALFEWDPATNVYTKEFDFTVPDGINPYTSLTESKGKLYGLTQQGGTHNLGVFFEWDPETNVYTKKKDLDGSNGSRPTLKDLSLIPAPVTNGLPGSCINFVTVTIDNNNNNDWVSIIDNEGSAVAEIKANGNNLGIVSASMFINNEDVREDESKRLFLDRNLTITPQFQPSSPVDIRLYIRSSEYLAIKNAVSSNGQPSGIKDINDLAIFKNPVNTCSPDISQSAMPVVTTVSNWENDYVLSTSISSFSSFYFANKAHTSLPLTLLEFNGRLINNNAALNWKTENEINTLEFIIERSTDGRSYHAVDTVASANTAGLHHYNFTDPGITSLNAAIVYYRLKQKDIDGGFSYSKIVALPMDNKKNLILFYPNPVINEANLTITINRPEQIRSRIIDNVGRAVKEQQWNLSTGSNSLSVDVKGLANGMYYLELKGESINVRKQFIKQ